MHVACPCGLRFAVSVDRLPIKYRCSGCSRLNWISEDGSLQAIEEGPRESKRIACRCGQPFLVDAGTFPRTVKCHSCGDRFTVLDTGEIIEVNEVPERSSEVGAIAIQTQPVPLTHELQSTAVSAELLPDAPTAGGSKLQTELKLIDLSWNFEIESHSLIPFGGIRIMPSKRLAAILGLGAIALWCCLTGLAIWFNLSHLILRIAELGLGPLALVGYIYAKAHAYENAEAAWQLKRIAVIAKWEVGASGK